MGFFIIMFIIIFIIMYCHRNRKQYVSEIFQDMLNKLIILKYRSSKNSVFRNGLCKVICPASILAITFANNKGVFETWAIKNFWSVYSSPWTFLATSSLSANKMLSFSHHAVSQPSAVCEMPWCWVMSMCGCEARSLVEGLRTSSFNRIAARVNKWRHTDFA